MRACLAERWYAVPRRGRGPRRIAKNQALFRTINEGGMAWPERQATPVTEKLRFYCECGDAKCFEHLQLTRPEYEAVRADSARFAVIPGHVFAGAEHVVEAYDDYAVVRSEEHTSELQ